MQQPLEPRPSYTAIVPWDNESKGRSSSSTQDHESKASDSAKPVQSLTSRFSPIVQRRLVQRRRANSQRQTADETQAAAKLGTSGASEPLPHLGAIQKSFGHHDLSQVRAYADGPAREGAEAMGAEAFTTGDQIAFAGAPDLHTAAHEAAHVVQQRAGVQLKGGVGQEGDPYEQQADAVADKVLRGESSEALLGQLAPTDATSFGTVQRKENLPGAEGLDRRMPGNKGEIIEEGSGPWGADANNQGMANRASLAKWRGIAAAAEAMGLPHAARHMRHYLANTGEPLTVDVGEMLRDLSWLLGFIDQSVDYAKTLAELRTLQLGEFKDVQAFSLAGEKQALYCETKSSRDWFYAVGGFTQWWTADVVVTRSRDTLRPTIEMSFVWHMQDRYNWDKGKAVPILGIFLVTDEELGRLHRVGLAKEYDIVGQSKPKLITWKSTPGIEPSPSNGIVPKAPDGQSGRSDGSRERK